MTRKREKSDEYSEEFEFERLQEDHLDLMDYNIQLADESDELRQENSQLKAAVENLRCELNALKEILSSGHQSTTAHQQLEATDPLPIQPKPTAGRITEVVVELTIQDKIGLFRSLFRGRNDVFAKRWESQQVNPVTRPLAALNGTAKYVVSLTSKSVLNVDIYPPAMKLSPVTLEDN